MRTVLLDNGAVPAFDSRITDFVAAQREGADGKQMVVGIRHSGRVYRKILCTGPHEYIDCARFLTVDLQLTDLLDGKPAENGIDSLFAESLG